MAWPELIKIVQLYGYKGNKTLTHFTNYLKFLNGYFNKYFLCVTSLGITIIKNDHKMVQLTATKRLNASTMFWLAQNSL